MARPGMTIEYDEMGFYDEQTVGRLEGPLRWAVDLNIASVAIATRPFP